MTVEQYEALAMHLTAVDPILESFCSEHGFERQLAALGRYPRRRVVRTRAIQAYFDLQMDLDPKGELYSEFFLEVPYSLGSGVWLDREGCRWGARLWCFRGVPFDEVIGILPRVLHRDVEWINGWTADRLIAFGAKRHLPSSVNG